VWIRLRGATAGSCAAEFEICGGPVSNDLGFRAYCVWFGLVCLSVGGEICGGAVLILLQFARGTICWDCYG
jgi:hypothetical protein